MNHGPMAQWFSVVQVIESREDLADFLQEHSTLTPGERCHGAAMEYDRYGVWGMGRHKADALTEAFPR